MMPSWLRVRRRGWEIERGEDWFQMHTVGCVEVGPVPAAPPQERAVEIAEAHRHGGKREVAPVNRHIVEPGSEAILAQKPARRAVETSTSKTVRLASHLPFRPCPALSRLTFRASRAATLAR